jgi:hypothetical protein
MKKIIRLSESQLVSLIEKVIKEQEEPDMRVTELPPVTVKAKRIQELPPVTVSLYKFVLSKPKDGVTFVIYNPRTGEFTENGEKGEVWANTKPNLSKEEVTAWFKRNNIRIKN